MYNNVLMRILMNLLGSIFTQDANYILIFGILHEIMEDTKIGNISELYFFLLIDTMNNNDDHTIILFCQ